MTWARYETIKRLFDEACNIGVVDAHTHIQDDLKDFDQAMAAQNLAGTQASINAFPDYVVQAGLKQRRLVRRTMTDATHGCLYSWFAEVAEGRRGRLDTILKAVGQNSEAERKKVGAARVAIQPEHEAKPLGILAVAGVLKLLNEQRPDLFALRFGVLADSI